MQTTMTVLRLPTLAAGLLFMAVPAHAEIPPPVQAMVDAALATDDAGKVQTVIDLAIQTNPGAEGELRQILAQYRAHKAAQAALAAVDKEQKIREAGLIDLWSGKGQIGAFQSSGNSNDAGISASLDLTRSGIDWRHQLRARADYQRSNGRTSREQYVFVYEPQYRISPSLFTYALAQYEHDRFQGYTGRYSLSGGIGYDILKKSSVSLSAKLGPAFRRTEFTDGTSANNLGGLLGLDFDWKLSKALTLTQDTNLIADSGTRAAIIIDSGNTSIVVVTGLEAKISDRLTTRVSYTLEYDSNPPVGAVSTDTLSRFTLVYGF